MRDSIELRLGRLRVVLVRRTAISALSAEHAARLLDEALEEPGGAAAIRRIAAAVGLDDALDLAKLIELLAARFDRERILVARLDAGGTSGLVAYGPSGQPLADDSDWDEFMPLADLLRRPIGGNPQAREPSQTPRSGPGQAPDRPDAEEPLSPQEPSVHRIELGALGFESEAVLTLPRPNAEGIPHPWAAITRLAIHLAVHPGARFVALGHQDIGEPVGHSLLRAAALVHFLRAERAQWVDIAAKWGRVRDVQYFLAYLRSDCGWTLPELPITGAADPTTTEAVLAFQRERNQKPETATPIYEDGVIGEQTLGAIFDIAHEDLRQWLHLRSAATSMFAFIDPARPSLACAERFKPYRTMPVLPELHGPRFVDVVIAAPVALGEISLGAAPEGAGIYDVDAIDTIPIGDISKPRRGLALELVLRDESGAAVAGAEYEVVLPGGAIRRGVLDQRGETVLEGLVEGSCRVRFPGLDAPYELCEVTALGKDGVS